ncbi:MAG: hypothetical protein LBO09_04395 [Candidatus Peribacteria bacterium]|nr:hypothetical protein [Candidatus Peribacteria bacterium]
MIIPGGLIVGEVNTNTISSPGILATIAGGSDNHIQGTSNNSTIGAGESNNINGATNSTIGAGRTNEIKQNVESSFVGGGDANIISASFSSIVGGKNNTISSPRSIIPGGTNNTINAGADYSFVAGQRGVVNNEGTFIWSDYSESYEYTQPWMNYD